MSSEVQSHRRSLHRPNVRSITQEHARQLQHACARFIPAQLTKMIIIQDGRLRLWANGLAFSRSVMRTGVPGRSKASRIELVR